MARPQMHLHGSAADHAEWAAAPAEDDFDEQALERAMTLARAQAYQALATIDAA